MRIYTKNTDTIWCRLGPNPHRSICSIIEQLFRNGCAESRTSGKSKINEINGGCLDDRRDRQPGQKGLLIDAGDIEHHRELYNTRLDRPYQAREDGWL